MSYTKNSMDIEARISKILAEGRQAMNRPICQGCGLPMAKAGFGSSGSNAVQRYRCNHRKCPRYGKAIQRKESVK